MDELSVEVSSEEDCGAVLSYRTQYPPRAGDELYLDNFGSFKVVSVTWRLEERGESHRVNGLLVWGYFLDDERPERDDD